MALFLKVIACEIAVREFYHVAASSRNLIDFEFLDQGYHDVPAKGRLELQKRIDAVPAGKYDAIVIGYGLCSNILAGLKPTHTRLVIPRAHDCITFFLGSKERYARLFAECSGTYFYTSGWIDCGKRRGMEPEALLNANVPLSFGGTYQDWVTKYGEDQARYLLEEMNRWMSTYTSGTLIDFEFTKPLHLDEKVQEICSKRHWNFSKIPGNLRLFEGLLNQAGAWPEEDFLVVQPGQVVAATYDDSIIKAQEA